MKKLLLLTLLSFTLCAMEDKTIKKYPYNKAASELIQDILTNKKSPWLNMNKEMSKEIAQLILKDTNFAQELKPVPIICKTRRYFPTQFSPDSKTILVLPRNNSAELWDLTGKCILTLKGHEGKVTSALFSPDGKTILTSSKDKTAKLWDLDGTCIHTFTGHTEIITSALFSPDGKTILTISYYETAKLWDLDGTCIHTFTSTEHGKSINSALFSPDSKTILIILSSISNTSSVQLWNVNDTYIHTLIKDATTTPQALFSPNGRTILTISDDKTVKLWDLDGTYIATLKGHTKSINSALFSPDSKTILTASDDKTMKLWDLHGTCIATLKGHTTSVYSALFSPDGNTILTASNDKSVKLWDLDGTCIATLKVTTENAYFVASAEFSPDGKTILTTYDKIVELWDLEGAYIDTFTKNNSFPSTPQFSPDGKTILIHLRNNAIQIEPIEDQFFTKEVTLPQALILVAINAIKWDKRIKENRPANTPETSLIKKDQNVFTHLINVFKFQNLSYHEPNGLIGHEENSSINENSNNDEEMCKPEAITFDFNKCPHLQKHYEALPAHIKNHCDKFVTKIDKKEEGHS